MRMVNEHSGTQEYSGLVRELLASQEGVCCIQIVVPIHNPQTGPCIRNVSQNDTRFLGTDLFICIYLYFTLI